MSPVSRWFGAALLTMAAVAPAHALFSDDEARKAILDLRERVALSDEQQRQRMAESNEQMLDELSQLKRSLLDLHNQLEQLRGDNARLRGQQEQLARDVAELQRHAKDLKQGVDERMSRFEPQKISLEGKEFLAEPEEKRLYDEAMTVMRSGNFAAAATSLETFQKRYPGSGYRESVLFWLGNAQYGKRDYKDAIATFRLLVNSAPTSMRAPEALLAIANCQLELKDSRSARRTIDELLKAYPQSEAAQAGKERLASLK